MGFTVSKFSFEKSTHRFGEDTSTSGTVYIGRVSNELVRDRRVLVDETSELNKLEACKLWARLQF